MAPLSMKLLNVHLFSMEQILSDMIHGPVRHGEDRSDAAISDHAGESINNGIIEEGRSRIYDVEKGKNFDCKSWLKGSNILRVRRYTRHKTGVG